MSKRTLAAVLQSPFGQDSNKYKRYLRQRLMWREPRFEIAFRALTVEDMEQIQAAEMEVIRELQTEIQEYNSYEEAIRDFKTKYNKDLIDFTPDQDGETHINIYSKSKTALGRKLSNFARTPINHPDYGHFSSIEAFWYWLSCGKTSNELRALHGIDAKNEGNRIRDKLKLTMDPATLHNPDFKMEIRKALLLKVEQTPGLIDELKACTLPFTHYYFWGRAPDLRISYPAEYAWIHEYLSLIRDWVHGKAARLLITGVGDEIKYTDLENMFDLSFAPVIEIITRGDKGPDGLAIRVAKKNQLPFTSMVPDWKKHDKEAAIVRDREVLSRASGAAIVYPSNPDPRDIEQTRQINYLKAFERQVINSGLQITLWSLKNG